MTKYLNRVERNQVPFATSRALNDTAKAAQGMIISRIGRVFANKKTWWKERQPTGVKIIRSNKKNLSAYVYSKAYFLELHEEGGIKTSKKGNNLAIPAKIAPKRFKKSGGARQLLNSNPRAFSTKTGIYRRRGKKRVEKLFTYSRTANINPVLDFKKTTRRAVIKHFERNFKKRLSQALKTAR